MVSYAGFCVASIFDEEISEDMNNIEWNPFNNDETMTVNSSKVSFYKGVPVYRIDVNGSLSFVAVLLCRHFNDKNWSMEELLKHEYGHTIQQRLLGPIDYLFRIGIQSYFFNDEDNPWEISADKLGGVVRSSDNEYKEENVALGWLYFLWALIF